MFCSFVLLFFTLLFIGKKYTILNFTKSQTQTLSFIFTIAKNKLILHFSSKYAGGKEASV
jgi:hypothetical protein